MSIDTKKQLIERLDAVQHATGILGCDLAFLLDITECYITNMRRWAYVSNNLAVKIKLLIDMLEARQQESAKPLFRKPGQISTADFKIKRQIMVENFKNSFLAAFESLTDKD